MMRSNLFFCVFFPGNKSGNKSGNEVGKTVLVLRTPIDMFVSTNCPGVCLGQSVSHSLWPKFPLIGQLNERENVLVSSV